MGKPNTVENRVYLFETLAESLLSGPVGDQLASSQAPDRARAIQALADVAYLSCVMADSKGADAEQVRQRMLKRNVKPSLSHVGSKVSQIVSLGPDAINEPPKKRSPKKSASKKSGSKKRASKKSASKKSVAKKQTPKKPEPQ